MEEGFLQMIIHDHESTFLGELFFPDYGNSADIEFSHDCKPTLQELIEDDFFADFDFDEDPLPAWDAVRNFLYEYQYQVTIRDFTVEQQIITMYQERYPDFSDNDILQMVRSTTLREREVLTLMLRHGENSLDDLITQTKQA